MLPWLLLTYLVGAVPFGLVISTLYGGEKDIRAVGSGNIGATNVLRVYGWRLALPTLLLDIGKGFLPTLGALVLWPERGLWWPAVVAAVAFLGHCYSVYLEFRGGKGVATGAGAMLAIAPVPITLAAVIWAVLLGLTGRSSVASLLAAIGLVGISAWWSPQIIPVVGLLAVGIIVTHLSNIRRLAAGQESQVVRGVRWGRKTQATGASVVEQGPGGRGPSPLWKEVVPDPLEPDEDVDL